MKSGRSVVGVETLLEGFSEPETEPEPSEVVLGPQLASIDKVRAAARSKESFFFIKIVPFMWVIAADSPGRRDWGSKWFFPGGG